MYSTLDIALPPPTPSPCPSSPRSHSTSDDYRSARSGFSRSQDSILDGYSTPSSSRSPSFLDYEAGPPLPPRDRLSATRASRSTDSADLLYEVPPAATPVNGDYALYASIKRRAAPGARPDEAADGAGTRPDSQSSTGTWSNHSSGYVPMKPAPPVKPPRKSVSPLNRALGQHQFHSKSQHQLFLQSNRASGHEAYLAAGGAESSMKRSASNDGEGYLDMRPSDPRFSTFMAAGAGQSEYENSRLISESAFSILYDEIANGSTGYGSMPPGPGQASGGPVCKVSSLSRKPQRPPPLHQHVRSKSEHHPRCPNYEPPPPPTHQQPPPLQPPPAPPIPPPHSRHLRKSDTEDVPQRKRNATLQLVAGSSAGGATADARYPESPTPDYASASPPSPQSAEQGIRSVIKPLSQVGL